MSHVKRFDVPDLRTSNQLYMETRIRKYLSGISEDCYIKLNLAKHSKLCLTIMFYEGKIEFIGFGVITTDPNDPKTLLDLDQFCEWLAKAQAEKNMFSSLSIIPMRGLLKWIAICEIVSQSQQLDSYGLSFDRLADDNGDGFDGRVVYGPGIEGRIRVDSLWRDSSDANSDLARIKQRLIMACTEIGHQEVMNLLETSVEYPDLKLMPDESSE